MKKSELRKIIKEEINRLNEDQKYSDEMEEFMDVLFADDIAPEQEPEVKGRTLILKYKNKKDYNKVKNMTV